MNRINTFIWTIQIQLYMNRIYTDYLRCCFKAHRNMVPHQTYLKIQTISDWTAGYQQNVIEPLKNAVPTGLSNQNMKLLQKGWETLLRRKCEITEITSCSVAKTKMTSTNNKWQVALRVSSLSDPGGHYSLWSSYKLGYT